MTRIDSVGEATWTGARVARRARPRDCPASVTCPAAPAALEPVGEGRVQVRLSDKNGTALEVARRQTRALRTALGLR